MGDAYTAEARGGFTYLTLTNAAYERGPECAAIITLFENCIAGGERMPAIIICFKAVRTFCTTCVDALRRLATDCNEMGGHVALCGPSDDLLGMLMECGLVPLLLTAHATVANAEAHFAR
jgi:anti-anti-sigma regulatory factor